jgi:hypothetical protein
MFNFAIIKPGEFAVRPDREAFFLPIRMGSLWRQL